MKDLDIVLRDRYYESLESSLNYVQKYTKCYMQSAKGTISS